MKSYFVGLTRFLNQFLANQRLRRLTILVFFNMVGFAVFNGVQRLFLFPFLSRVLGETRFGDFLVGFSFTGVLAVIPAASISSSMMRSHASYRNETHSSFFKTIAIISFFIGPLIAILYFSLVWLLHDVFANVNLRAFRVGLALYTCFNFIYVMFGGILGCKKRYISKSIFDIISGLLLLISALLLWLINPDWTPLSLLIVSAAVVGLQIFALRDIFQGSSQIESSVLELVWTTSPFYLGASVMEVFLQYGNRWILAYFLDSNAVSAYYVGSSIVLLFGLLPSVLAQLETLIISQRATVKDIRWSDLKLILLGVVTFSVVLTLLAAVLGKLIMATLYGTELANKGMGVFYILLVALFFYTPIYLLRPFVIKFCSPRVPMTFGMITATIAVVLSIIFVPRMGINGGAIALSVATMMSGLLYTFQFTRRVLIPVLTEPRKSVQHD